MKVAFHDDEDDDYFKQDNMIALYFEPIKPRIGVCSYISSNLFKSMYDVDEKMKNTSLLIKKCESSYSLRFKLYKKAYHRLYFIVLRSE